MISSEQLVAILPRCPEDKAGAYAGCLGRAMAEAQITSVVRGAAFLAQVGHESDGLRALVEYASGDAYEGRHDLGNVRPGDGRRYKGRGWLMLTGRAAYHVAGRALGLELEEHPDLAAEPEHAARIAAWFWANGAGLRLSRTARAYLSRYGIEPLNLNRVADALDLIGVTYAINGLATPEAPSYLERRRAIYYRALEVLGRGATIA